MFNWRSKVSNKKSDNKQILNPVNSTNVSSSKPNDTINNEKLKQSTSRQLPKFFRFSSSLPKKSSQQTISELDQKLDQEFQSLDIDADGYVSIADLQSVLKNFPYIYNSNETVLRILDKLDINHDQRISKHEFKLYKKALLDRDYNRTSIDDNISSTFSIFDRNHDNYITAQEIRETMHNLGENIDDNLINEMVETADIDHDGRISRDEFEKLFSILKFK